MNLREILKPRVTPFQHQWEALEKGGNKFSFAFLMDPGTGKTKVTIDNAAWLYGRGVITGLLIVAPGDVPEQWLSEQMPLYWPEHYHWRSALWRSSNNKAIRECTGLALHPTTNYFHVLAMNKEALATSGGVRCATAFLKTFPSMFVLDESDDFKNPKALRTRAALRLAPLARVRRILTGTVADTPFDLYSQFQFLDHRILGCPSYLVFKHHYGVFAKEYAVFIDKKSGQKKLRPYESLQHYQRLDELYAKIDPYSYRKTKEQCVDLPPKILSPLFTHLSVRQRQIYDTIKDHSIALLRGTGDGVELHDPALMDDEELIAALKNRSDRMQATLKIVMMLRLQQCLGGFVTDDTGRTRCIEKEFTEVPRARATLDKVLEIVRSGQKVIVWAQFRAEIEAIAGALQADSTGMVHGGITGDRRTRIFNAFKDPDSAMRALVAHPRTAGVGMNFAVATAAIYYSDGYSFRQRKQSEDRIHRIGQNGTVNIYDLNAREVPLDSSIAEVRAAKKNLSDAIMTGTAADLEKLC